MIRLSAAFLLAANAALSISSALAYTPDLFAGFRRRADGSSDATRDYAYSYDGAGNVVRAGRVDAASLGRAARRP